MKFDSTLQQLTAFHVMQQHLMSFDTIHAPTFDGIQYYASTFGNIQYYAMTLTTFNAKRQYLAPSYNIIVDFLK